jgi:very-short-patch-repair endonuclease
MPKKIEKAKTLRRNSTDAEILFWQIVRNNHFKAKFRRQVPVGRYVVDFLCHELKLIIEIDGGQHCESKRDEIRTRYLKKLGFDVIRFWNNEVLENPEGVASTLTLALSQRRGD